MMYVALSATLLLTYQYLVNNIDIRLFFPYHPVLIAVILKTVFSFDDIGSIGILYYIITLSNRQNLSLHKQLMSCATQTALSANNTGFKTRSPTITSFPSSISLSMVVSLPSQLCFCTSLPFSRVTTFWE